MTVEIFKSTSACGRIRSQNADYATAHDAASGNFLSVGQTQGIIANEKPAAYYNVWRSFLYFPTVSLPDDANITRVRVGLRTDSPLEADLGQTTLHIVEGVQGDTLAYADFGAHLSKTTSGGSIDIAGMGVTNNFFWVTLNATGRGWVNKTGLTKLCLRSAGDIAKTVPSGRNYFSYKGTVSAVPTITAKDASSVGGSSATLNGEFTIQPFVLEVTYEGTDAEYPQVRFQYGLSTAYGTDTAWQRGKPMRETFSQIITGLASETLYHFRAQAKNAAGTGSGSDKTFTTTKGYLGNINIDQLIYQHAERMR